MAGLLQQAQSAPEQAPVTPEEGLPEDSATESATESSGGAQEASPEEQAQYDAIVTKAMELMYGKETNDAVVERMQAMKDNIPVMLGTLAANLSRAGVAELRQQGQQVDDEIVAYAGFEIIAELIDLASAAKIVPEGTDLEDIGHQAMYVAIRKYTEMASKAGEISPEQQQEARDALAQFQQQGQGQQ